MNSMVSMLPFFVIISYNSFQTWASLLSGSKLVGCLLSSTLLKERKYESKRNSFSRVNNLLIFFAKVHSGLVTSG